MVIVNDAQVQLLYRVRIIVLRDHSLRMMLLKLVFEENSGALLGPAGCMVIVVMLACDVKL